MDITLIFLGIILVLQTITIIILAISLDKQRKEINNQLKDNRTELSDAIRNSNAALGTSLNESQKAVSERQDIILKNMTQIMDNRLGSIQKDTTEKLDQMRKVVDEKLENTLNNRLTQSFKQVSQQLENVYKGLGEMQTLANGVGDLKKVLSNVKTRGIVGEIQLGTILSQIMSKEQYAENVYVAKNKKEVVEFAIKLPGEKDAPVWLPIDSKFPGETYSNLIDAYDSADQARIEAARKELVTRIKGCAKDIRDKYIEPPFTTDFAIMFLPFEGLYAEVLNLGLVEILQREYHVNIAGPTTMAALMNSLQMGFRTLAIQERSSEAWKVLSAVKNEFTKFGDMLKTIQGRLQMADKEIDTLITTRTNVMLRALRNVEELNDESSSEVLKISDDIELRP